MRAKIAIVFVLLATVCQMSACKKAEIRGIVRDTDGKPLEGVAITVPTSAYKAETSKNGEYVLAYAPGSFRVDFVKAGYISKSLSLNLSTETEYQAEAVVMPRALTEDEAKRLIVASEGYPISQFNKVLFGRVSEVTPEQLMSGGLAGVSAKKLASLVRDKLITIRYVETTKRDPMWGNVPDRYSLVEFTPEGAKYHNGQVEGAAGLYWNLASVLACKEDFSGIVGMSPSADGAQVIVTYTTRFGDPTPFLPDRYEYLSFVCSGTPGPVVGREYGYTGQPAVHRVAFEYNNGWSLQRR
jgi:hypothetical protein